METEDTVEREALLANLQTRNTPLFLSFTTGDFQDTDGWLTGDAAGTLSILICLRSTAEADDDQMIWPGLAAQDKIQDMIKPDVDRLADKMRRAHSWL